MELAYILSHHLAVLLRNDGRLQTPSEPVVRQLTERTIGDPTPDHQETYIGETNSEEHGDRGLKDLHGFLPASRAALLGDAARAGSSLQSTIVRESYRPRQFEPDWTRLRRVASEAVPPGRITTMLMEGSARHSLRRDRGRY